MTDKDTAKLLADQNELMLKINELVPDEADVDRVASLALAVIIQGVRILTHSTKNPELARRIATDILEKALTATAAELSVYDTGKGN